MLSLNQITKLLSNFANAHRMVNSYGEGMVQDFATSGTTNYPAMWVDFENPTISINTDGGVFKNVVRVYLGDRLLKGQGNLTDVLSDTQRTLIDLLAYCQNQTYLSQTQTILEQTNYTFNAFFEQFSDDEIAGYYVDLTFKSSYDSNSCQIPFDSSIIIT